MRRRLAVVAERATRVIRGLWPDRNPLRRTVDRAEGVIVAVLAVVFLAGAPLAAAAAGNLAYSVGSRSAHAQRAAWHQVPAVIVATIPPSGYVYQTTVQVSWAGPDGKWHTGVVAAPLHARPGGSVKVWVDATGELTGPPLQRSQVRHQAELAAIGAPLGLGFIVLWAGLLAKDLLDRHRLAGWEAEWRATGPQWTRQR
jgi:hypothetical protein